MIQLRQYQQDIHDAAVGLLRQHHIAYIAAEMRTGKTLTALSIARTMDYKRVLFFTRKKALTSINKDYEQGKFTFQFKALNYEALGKYASVSESETDSDRVSTDFNIRIFASEYFLPDLVILDEAHGLGQYPTQARKVKGLKAISEAIDIIYLSGTPSPESYSQLYHQFFISSFSPFLQWKNFYEWAGGTFKKTPSGGKEMILEGFVNKKTTYFFGRQQPDYSDADKEKVFSYCQHLFITMSQKEAEFKQEVRDILLPVKMKHTTYLLANRLLKDKLVRGNDKSIVMGDTVVKLQQKLHQIYSGTVIAEILFDEQGNNLTEPEKVAKIFDNSKAEFIKHHFEGQKIAVFYVFKAELDLLILTFGHDKMAFTPEDFEARPDSVFVSQIQSGREGIDLKAADALVFLNIAFSAVSYSQGRQRHNFRDRQTVAPAYFIVCADGIEQKIYNRVIDKQDYTVEYFKQDFGIK